MISYAKSFWLALLFLPLLLQAPLALGAAGVCDPADVSFITKQRELHREQLAAKATHTEGMPQSLDALNEAQHALQPIGSADRSVSRLADEVASLFKLGRASEDTLPTARLSKAEGHLPAGVIDAERGQINFDKLGKIIPTPAKATPSDWKKFEAALKEIEAHLNDPKTTRIVDVNGVTHERANYVSELEKSLRQKWVDEKKARIIAQEALNAFPDATKAEEKLLNDLIHKYHQFIGIHNDNARKIFLGQPFIRDSPAMRAAAEKFLDRVSQNLSKAREGKEARPGSGVAILTQEGGGAHVAIADTLQHTVGAVIDSKVVNLSKPDFKEGLELTLGIKYTDAYNQIFMQGGNPKAKAIIDRINARLFDFVPSEENLFLRRQADGVGTFVSTTHWLEDVAVIAELNRPIVFQICDYGPIYYTLQSLGKDIIDYDLKGIKMLLPSESSRLLERGKLANVEKFPEIFVPIDYPVEKAWKTAPTLAEAREIRANFSLREDARLATLMAGSQGGPVIKEVITGLVGSAARTIARNEELPKIDIAAIFGKNAELRNFAAAEFEKAIQGAEEGLTQSQRALLRENVRLVPLGFVPNERLAQLVQISDSVVTKPGGRTAAELITAGVPKPIILVDEKLHWEMGNVGELQRVLGAEKAAENRIGEQVLNRLMNPLEKVKTPRRGEVSDAVIATAKEEAILKSDLVRGREASLKSEAVASPRARGPPEQAADLEANPSSARLSKAEENQPRRGALPYPLQSYENATEGFRAMAENPKAVHFVTDIDGNFAHMLEPGQKCPKEWCPGLFSEHRISYAGRDETYIVPHAMRAKYGSLVESAREKGVEVNFIFFSGGPKERNELLLKSVKVLNADGSEGKSLWETAGKNRNGEPWVLNREHVSYVDGRIQQSDHYKAGRLNLTDANLVGDALISEDPKFGRAIMFKDLDKHIREQLQHDNLGRILLLDDHEFFSSAAGQEASLLRSIADKKDPVKNLRDWEGRFGRLLDKAVDNVAQGRDVRDGMVFRQTRIVADKKTGEFSFQWDFRRVEATANHNHPDFTGEVRQISLNGLNHVDKRDAEALQALQRYYGVMGREGQASLEDRLAALNRILRTNHQPPLDAKSIAPHLYESFLMERLEKVDAAGADAYRQARARQILEDFPALGLKPMANSAKEEEAIAAGIKASGKANVMEATREQIILGRKAFEEEYLRVMGPAGDLRRAQKIADLCHAGAMCAAFHEPTKIAEAVEAIRGPTSPVRLSKAASNTVDLSLLEKERAAALARAGDLLEELRGVKESLKRWVSLSGREKDLAATEITDRNFASFHSALAAADAAPKGSAENVFKVRVSDLHLAGHRDSLEDLHALGESIRDLQVKYPNIRFEMELGGDLFDRAQAYVAFRAAFLDHFKSLAKSGDAAAESALARIRGGEFSSGADLKVLGQKNWTLMNAADAEKLAKAFCAGSFDSCPAAVRNRYFELVAKSQTGLIKAIARDTGLPMDSFRVRLGDHDFISAGKGTRYIDLNEYRWLLAALVEAESAGNVAEISRVTKSLEAIVTEEGRNLLERRGLLKGKGAQGDLEWLADIEKAALPKGHREQLEAAYARQGVLTKLVDPTEVEAIPALQNGWIEKVSHSIGEDAQDVAEALDHLKTERGIPVNTKAIGKESFPSGQLENHVSSDTHAPFATMRSFEGPDGVRYEISQNSGAAGSKVTSRATFSLQGSDGRVFFMERHPGAPEFAPTRDPRLVMHEYDKDLFLSLNREVEEARGARLAADQGYDFEALAKAGKKVENNVAALTEETARRTAEVEDSRKALKAAESAKAKAWQSLPGTKVGARGKLFQLDQELRLAERQARTGRFEAREIAGEKVRRINGQMNILRDSLARLNNAEKNAEAAAARVALAEKNLAGAERNLGRATEIQAKAVGMKGKLATQVEAASQKIIKSKLGRNPLEPRRLFSADSSIAHSLDEKGRLVASLERQSDGTYKLSAFNKLKAEAGLDGSLREGISNGLEVAVDGHSIPIGQPVSLKPGDVVELRFYGTRLGSYAFDGEKFSPKISQKIINRFDISRFANDPAFVEGVRSGAEKWRPFSPEAKTFSSAELHSHLTGAIEADSLVALGLKRNMGYPEEILRKIVGLSEAEKSPLRWQRGKNGEVLLRSLSREELNQMIAKMQIFPDQIGSFDGILNDIYVYRRPFSTSAELFPDILHQSARELAAGGINFAQFSHTGRHLTPEFLAMVSRELPIIERQTGVKIQIIYGIDRTKPIEEILDSLETYRAMNNRHVAGIDFLGEEVESLTRLHNPAQGETRVQAAILRILREKPEAQIKFHAGESPAFPENVRLAVEMGANRIGHGTYGFLGDSADATLAAIAKAAAEQPPRRVFVELQRSSNIALDYVREGQILKKVDGLLREKNIPHGAYTDGHGIYGSMIRGEFSISSSTGATYGELQKIRESERQIYGEALRFEIRQMERERAEVALQIQARGEASGAQRSLFSGQLHQLERDIDLAQTKLKVNDLLQSSEKLKSPAGTSTEAWLPISGKRVQQSNELLEARDLLAKGGGDVIGEVKARLERIEQSFHSAPHSGFQDGESAARLSKAEKVRTPSWVVISEERHLGNEIFRAYESVKKEFPNEEIVFKFLRRKGGEELDMGARFRTDEGRQTIFVMGEEGAHTLRNAKGIEEIMTNVIGYTPNIAHDFISRGDVFGYSFFFAKDVNAHPATYEGFAQIIRETKMVEREEVAQRIDAFAAREKDLDQLKRFKEIEQYGIDRGWGSFAEIKGRSLGGQKDPHYITAERLAGSALNEDPKLANWKARAYLYNVEGATDLFANDGKLRILRDGKIVEGPPEMLALNHTFGEIPSLRKVEFAAKEPVVSEGARLSKAATREEEASQAAFKTRLQKLIKAKFDVGVEAELKGKPWLPLEEESKAHLKALASVWRDIRGTAEDLRLKVEAIAESGIVADVEAFQASTKEFRANLKVIRFLCEDLCTKGTQAEHLDQLIKTMGHLAIDAAKGDSEVVAKTAGELRKLLKDGNLKDITREMEKMKAVGDARLNERIEDSLREIRKGLKKTKFTEVEEHLIRKAEGGLMSLQALRVLAAKNAAPADKSSFQFVRELYDSLGLLHDDMEAGKTAKRMPIGEADRENLLAVIGYYRQSDRINVARLSQAADEQVAPALKVRGHAIYDDKGISLLSVLGQREVKVEKKLAAELADARAKYLRGEISEEEVESTYRLHNRNFPTGSVEKKRLALLRDEENFQAVRSAQAQVNLKAATGSEGEELEKAFHQARAAHVRAQEQLEGANTAYWKELNSSGGAARQARADGVTALPRAFERYAEFFPNRSFSQVLENPGERKLLRSLWSAEAKQGSQVEREGQQLVRKALQDVAEAETGAEAEARAGKLETSMRSAYAEFAKIEEIPSSEELKSNLAKKGWKPAEIKRAEEKGLLGEMAPAGSKASDSTDLSALAQERLLKDDARWEGRVQKGPAAENAGQRIAVLDEQVKALGEEAKRFDAMAAKTASAEEKSNLAESAERARAAQRLAQEERASLQEAESALGKARTLGAAEEKQAERLGNDATHLLENYLKAKSKKELEAISPGLGRFSLRGAAESENPFEKIRELRTAPISAEDRAKLFADVKAFAVEKQNGKFAELNKGLAAGKPDVVKAFAEAQDIAKSGLGTSAERALLESHGLNPHHQALANAIGVTEHSPEPGLLREARVKTEIAKVQTEATASEGRALASLEKPGPMAGAEINKELNAAFGAKSKTPVTLAEREALAEALKTVEKQTYGKVVDAGVLEAKADAKNALKKLEQLAAQDAESFLNYGMAYKETARIFGEHPERGWKSAWEQGVRRMLEESGMDSTQISRKVEGGNMTFLQQTALCLAM